MRDQPGRACGRQRAGERDRRALPASAVHARSHFRRPRRSAMSGPVAAPSGHDGPVTIITQTRVEPDAAAAFAHWQQETGKIVAGFPGFIDQTVMPPRPPGQVDWVILQRFASGAEARAWLNSD